MNTTLKTGLLSAALAGAIGAGVALHSDVAQADEHGADKVKCYGVAKAGQNDCGAADGSHSCAGHSTKDNDVNAWKFATEEECHEMGGGLTPEEAGEHHGDDHHGDDHGESH